MGYDVYGLNPKQNEVPPAVLSKFYDENGWNNWDAMTEKDRTAYFAAQNEHQDLNPGEYFRANVWFWRPIWTFVCGACSDFLSDKDMDAGCSNSGDRISKTKSLRIASRLRSLHKQGIIKTWEDEMLIPFEKAKKHNEKVRKEMDTFQKKMKKKHGDNIAPQGYPKDDYKKWESIHDKEDWTASYPPSMKAILEFERFCNESGGFEIC